MTPAARVQAAVELLDQIIHAARNSGPAADRLLADGFRNRRYAGAKDRRAIRELVYRAIRACGPVPETGRAAMLRLAGEDEAVAALFDGSPHGPEPIGASEQAAEGGIAPEWLTVALTASGIDGGEAGALLTRAPLDVRINSLVAGPLVLPEPGEPTAAPHGLRFPSGTLVEQWPAYLEGRIEVQDTGSQLACMAVGAKPREAIVDLCAGAGGKTLALAAAMAEEGDLLACDTDRARLSRLAPRAERAGATNIVTRLLNPGRELEALVDWQGRADAVLVDAPCSGTGTWRRNPEARWRLSPAQLARYGATQARLLDIAAALVRPGGRLVYVTCSLLDTEGADRIAAFLGAHPGWQAEYPQLPLGARRGQGLRLSPFHDDTDGFFIARLFHAC
jgi:16S rRNA (cytosine967-C5)-methyltransferase